MPGTVLSLPCEDVFAGPVPKLLLSRLAEIAAEHVRFDSVPDSPIRLPAAQLALGYRFTSGRELLEEPVLVENSRLIPEAPSHPSEDFTPNAGLPKSPESSLDGKQDSRNAGMRRSKGGIQEPVDRGGTAQRESHRSP